MRSRFQTIANWGLFVINLLLLIAISYMVSTNEINFGQIKALDLVMVLLTVVTIVVAAIGIFVAIAAIAGYQTIASQAQRSAIDASLSRLEEIQKEDGFIQRLQKLVDDRIESYERNRATENVHVGEEEAEQDEPPRDDEEWRD